MRLASILLIGIVASAHVGSPNVVFNGNAGPYPVLVVVRPPDVVPGTAEVIVRVEAADVERVLATPVFYRAGASGAPRAEPLQLVAGQTNLYSGTLWLMTRGSSSVYVTVNGKRGSGVAIVPVAAIATSRLGISNGLAAILIVLGFMLFAGLVSIVQAASGEALLEPGVKPNEDVRNRARLAGMIAIPVLGMLVLGGAKWWDAVDQEYQHLMYKPPRLVLREYAREDSATGLSIRLNDVESRQTLLARPLPDHGKLMHFFVVDEGAHRVFAHLHPVALRPNRFQFDVGLPALPAGRYRAFADVVLENGMSFTATERFVLAAQTRGAPADSDDSWSIVDRIVPLRPGASQPLDDGLSLVYTGDSAIHAKAPVTLSFEVRGNGSVMKLEPYLGMAAHAVVLRSDESVFIHLHPMGTVSTDAQQAFVKRDSVLGTATAGAMHAMPMTFDGHFQFPYEFPRPGRYRMWVQVKADKRILTGAFDIDVR